MGCKNLDKAQSRNVIVDIKGREKPEELVIAGGHIDSWDVGSGAHDDGQAIILTWEALRIIKTLIDKDPSFRPRRTIRFVAFTNEENGAAGATAYHDKEKQENHISDHAAAIETDSGCFELDGFEFKGSDEAEKLISQLWSKYAQSFDLLKPCAAGLEPIRKGLCGVDVQPLANSGVPCLLLRQRTPFWEKDYFLYHHTEADTPDKIDRKHLTNNVLVMAVLLYLLADHPQRLPHHPPSDHSAHESLASIGSNSSVSRSNKRKDIT